MIRNKHIFILCYITFLFIGFSCTDNDSYINKKVYLLNQTLREKKFYNNGVLKATGFTNKGKIIGYVKHLDSLGRVNRISRYGWTGELKNLLVEDIVLDTIGNIDYSKSMFLKTIPNAISDTIYYSLRDTNFLDLKLKFYYPIPTTKNSINYRIIVKSDNLLDTVYVLNKEGWGEIQLNNLKKGIKKLHFDIKVNRNNGTSTIHESRRILKISE